MANPNWIDKWPPDDLKQLVHKREVEKKSFAAIAVEMGQNEGSCGRRYREIVAARLPDEIKPQPRRRFAPLHVELGIETYVHQQAVLGEPGGLWGNKRNQSFSHWYRYPVTLAKVFA
jgi:hypothetical protein